MSRLSWSAVLLVTVACAPACAGGSRALEQSSHAPRRAPSRVEQRVAVADEDDRGTETQRADAEATGHAPDDDETPLSRIPGLSVFPARDGHDGDVATMPCGAYAVERRDDGDTFGHVRVVRAGGSVAFDAKPKDPLGQYDVAWCFDASGDGAPELAITYASGGAHCCHREIVLSLGAAGVTKVIELDTGNASGITPDDVDYDGHYELVAMDDILVQLGSLPYAMTRLLPIVYAYRGQRWMRSTRRYGAWLRGARAAALAELATCRGEETCARGAGEYVLGLSLLIGDWDTQKKSLNLPRELVNHLDALSVKLSARLDAR